MLNIVVGLPDDEDCKIKQIFYGQYEDEWFDDPFVKRMVKEIDNSEVISANLIQSPVLGPISCEKLSGGVKVLIMLYKMPEIQQWGSSCGNNCMELMAEIGKMQNITVKFSHIPENFPENLEARFMDNGEIVHQGRELTYGIADRLDEAIRAYTDARREKV